MNPDNSAPAFTTQQAMIVSALAAGGAYLAYRTNVLNKKMAVGVGGGIVALSLVASEFSSLSGSLPWVIGGGLVIVAAIMLV